MSPTLLKFGSCLMMFTAPIADEVTRRAFGLPMACCVLQNSFFQSCTWLSRSSRAPSIGTAWKVASAEGQSPLQAKGSVSSCTFVGRPYVQAIAHIRHCQAVQGNGCSQVESLKHRSSAANYCPQSHTSHLSAAVLAPAAAAPGLRPPLPALGARKSAWNPHL